MARELSFVFEEVPKSHDIAGDFQKVKIDRGMQHYQEVLAWTKLLLSGLGPTASAGTFNTLSLLYPMERIFEDYVAHCLHKNMPEALGEGARLKTQVGGKALINDHNDKPMFRLHPDIMATEDFTKLVPSLIDIIGYGTAFYFLTLSLKTMPVGIAYAIWAGLGIVLVAIVTAVLYKEIPDWPAMFGIGLIVSGVLVINLFSATGGH